MTETNGYTIRKSIYLKDLQGLTKSTEDNFNFILHERGKIKQDFLINCKVREELLTSVKGCYFSLMRRNLPIYGVHGKIVKYATPKQNVFWDLSGA